MKGKHKIVKEVILTGLDQRMQAYLRDTRVMQLTTAAIRAYRGGIQEDIDRTGTALKDYMVSNHPVIAKHLEII